MAANLTAEYEGMKGTLTRLVELLASFGEVEALLPITRYYHHRVFQCSQALTMAKHATQISQVEEIEARLQVAAQARALLGAAESTKKIVGEVGIDLQNSGIAFNSALQEIKKTMEILESSKINYENSKALVKNNSGTFEKPSWDFAEILLPHCENLIEIESRIFCDSASRDFLEFWALEKICHESYLIAEICELYDEKKAFESLTESLLNHANSMKKLHEFLMRRFVPEILTSIVREQPGFLYALSAFNHVIAEIGVTIEELMKQFSLIATGQDSSEALLLTIQALKGKYRQLLVDFAQSGDSGKKISNFKFSINFDEEKN